MKIAVSAISLGILIMLISICTGLGLKKSIQENISAISSHILITSVEQNPLFTSSPVSFEQSFYSRLESIPQVKHIQAFATRPAILKTDEQFEGIVFKAVSSDYDFGSFSKFICQGAIPRFGIGQSSDSILISQKTASVLGLNVGDKAKSYFVQPSGTPVLRYFTIAGIFNTGISSFDQNIALADLRTISQLNRWDSTQVGGLEIVLDHSSDIDKVLPEILSIADISYGVSTMRDSYGDLLDWVELFDVNILVILGIIIIVSGVNMITVLLILILDKTQFIGILKSLGASDSMVRKVFLFNAFYIILKGLFWGNVIGLTLLLIQKYFGVISLDPDTYSVEVVPVYLNIRLILAINIITATINMLMLVLPSYFISRIRPARSIKF